MKRLLYVLVVLMILGGLSSCRTQYIPVETIKTEYHTRDSIRHDSIYQQDSVYVTVKGDTIYEYKYKYLYKYQYINKTDTLMKTDSIQIPYPVEKQLSKWQRFKLDFGGVVMLLVVIIVIVKLKNLKM
nr:MAG TPA: protein of unknown function (DUF4969) [Caudoviricetes sp.]